MAAKLRLYVNKKEIKLTAAEITVMRRTAGYIRLDSKNNLDIGKELNTQPITEFVQNYRCNWVPHDLQCPAK
jgi:hypothetical protein